VYCSVAHPLCAVVSSASSGVSSFAVCSRLRLIKLWVSWIGCDLKSPRDALGPFETLPHDVLIVSDVFLFVILRFILISSPCVLVLGVFIVKQFSCAGAGAGLHRAGPGWGVLGGRHRCHCDCVSFFKYTIRVRSETFFKKKGKRGLTRI